jgi:hypothetical protein
MAIIPATWKVEIKKIEVQDSPKLLRSHFNHYLGMVVHACHPSYIGSINREVTVQAKM